MRFSDLVFAVLSGFLAGAAFPKIEWPFMAWIAFIPLLAVLARKGARRPYLVGWLAGTVFYGILLYWIPAVPSHYAGMSTALSLGVYLLLILVLGMSWALFALAFSFMHKRRPAAAFAAAPFLWVGVEYLLTHVLTGFPWGLVGLSQYGNLSLIQIASVTGVYGVSFVLVLFQSLFVYSIRAARRLPFAFGIVLMVLVHLGGFLSMGRVTPTERSFPAAVIQGNVSSEIYWTQTGPDKIMTLFEEHMDLTRQASEKGAKLVIWPEFTVPLCFSCDDPLYQSFKGVLTRFVEETGTSLLVGSNETSGPPEAKLYFNSSLCLNPGRPVTSYATMHLVPFGEYTPYKKILGFVEKVSHAIGELTPGSGPALHTFRDLKFGTPICYEVIFPNLVRRFTKAGADFLVTITNDGWYGRSSAPYQHFANAVLRAVENRRFLLRAATTGISGVIDPYGRVLARSEIGVKTFLAETVTPSSALTFYARFGDVFSWACLTIGALLFIVACFKRPT
jgi:apolipoprotein N-acyltransferase